MLVNSIVRVMRRSSNCRVGVQEWIFSILKATNIAGVMDTEKENDDEPISQPNQLFTGTLASLQSWAVGIGLF